MKAPWPLHGAFKKAPLRLHGALNLTWRHHGGAVVSPRCIQPTMGTPWRLHGGCIVVPEPAIATPWQLHGGPMVPPWLRPSSMTAPRRGLCPMVAPRRLHGGFMAGSKRLGGLKAPWSRHGGTMVTPWWTRSAIESLASRHGDAMSGSKSHGVAMALMALTGSHGGSVEEPWRHNEAAIWRDQGAMTAPRHVHGATMAGSDIHGAAAKPP